MIPFNKPYLTGRENAYIEDVIATGRLAGNGVFTKKCHERLAEEYGLKNSFLTTSATAALEMASLLIDIQPSEEIILPSFTFVATASAFALRGAKLVFLDCQDDQPNLDVRAIEQLITDKTKAIVVMHYAGMACEMREIMTIAERHGIVVIEDAAHSIGAKFEDRSLGTIGHLSAFSFHETKNISAGQGGLLVVNDEKFLDRAAVIWDRGTNRHHFDLGKVNSYSWNDHGSNFYPPEITAAFLLAQLEDRKHIEADRARCWNYYYSELSLLTSKGYSLPIVKPYQSNNHHIFYLICPSKEERDALIQYLKQQEILAVFHYSPLHRSEFIANRNATQQKLINADFFSDHLVRLPLYTGLKNEELRKITEQIIEFVNARSWQH